MHLLPLLAVAAVVTSFEMVYEPVRITLPDGKHPHCTNTMEPRERDEAGDWMMEYETKEDGKRTSWFYNVNTGVFVHDATESAEILTDEGLIIGAKACRELYLDRFSHLCDTEYLGIAWNNGHCYCIPSAEIQTGCNPKHYKNKWRRSARLFHFVNVPDAAAQAKLDKLYGDNAPPLDCWEVDADGSLVCNHDGKKHVAKVASDCDE